MNVEDPPDHRQHDVIDSPVFIKTISNNDSCLSDYLLENELIPDDLIVDDPDSSVVSQQQLADETPNKEIQVNEIVNELVDQVASIKQQETTTTATDQSNQFFIGKYNERNKELFVLLLPPTRERLVHVFLLTWIV